MLPKVLETAQGHLFNFYFENRVREGFRYGQSLYGLAYKCPKASRLTAYQFACELSEQEYSVLITVSQDEYHVWLKLDAGFANYWSDIKCTLEDTQNVVQAIKHSLKAA
jgi:hypothetical protein